MVLPSSEQKGESITSLYQLCAITESRSKNGSLIYLYGGEDSDGFWTNNLIVINVACPSNKKFITRGKVLSWIKPKYSSFPPKKDGHAMALCTSNQNKKLVMFAGSDNQHVSGQNNALYSVDLSSLQWKVDLSHEQSSTRPTGRTQSGFTQVDNNLFIFGGKVTGVVVGKSDSGDDIIGNKILDDFWVFNSEEGSWKKLSNKLADNTILPELCGCSLCPSNKGDVIYLYGGYTGKDYSNELYRYNIKNNVWEILTSKTKGVGPQHGRERHSSILIPQKNEMFVSGGWIFGGVSSSIYALDLETLTWRAIETKGVDSKLLRRYGHTSVCIEVTRDEQYVIIIGGKDISMANRPEMVVLSLNGAESVQAILQSIAELQSSNKALEKDWATYEKLATPLAEPVVSEEYASNVIGIKLNKPSTPVKEQAPQLPVKKPTRQDETPVIITKKPEQVVRKEQVVEVPKVLEKEPETSPKVTEIPKVVETKPKIVEKEPEKKPVEPETVEIKEEIVVQVQREQIVEPPKVLKKEPESIPTVIETPKVVEKEQQTKGPKDSTSTTNFISDKLQTSEGERVLLESVKKNTSRQQRKPRSQTINVAKNLDKLEKEAKIEVPSEEKFKVLEQEAKKIDEPVVEQAPVQEKKPRGGVSMFGPMGMGMGGMMGELSAKLKKKQDQ